MLEVVPKVERAGSPSSSLDTYVITVDNMTINYLACCADVQRHYWEIELLDFKACMGDLVDHLC
jgi:hypothetical protein